MKILPPIEAILAEADVDDDAMTVRLTGTLDRKSYVAVNKVLEALGGKWNRKVQAHVFSMPPSGPMRAAMTTGKVRTHADIQFFRTPLELANRLLTLADVRPGDTFLEPSAGDGGILGPLLAAGARGCAFELDDANFRRLTEVYGYHTDLTLVHGDFLREDPVPCTAALKVVMNPPFAKVLGHDCLDHVRHAEAFIAHGILVAVMPVSIKFREDKRFRDFRKWIHSSRFSSMEIIDLPEDTFASSGTRVQTCVLILQRD